MMCAENNEITNNLKLCCDSCKTIFYVLADKFECPECYAMVDPKARFDLGYKSRKSAVAEIEPERESESRGNNQDDLESNGDDVESEE